MRNGGEHRTLAQKDHTIGYSQTSRTSWVLLAALAIGSTGSAYSSVVTFDFDTGYPPLSAYQNLPKDQAAGGLTAHFSAVTGAFSIQTESSTGYHLAQFSGNYLYPNLVRGNVLRMQFSSYLTDITFPFATTDYRTSHAQPTPIVMTASSTTPTTTNVVGTVTQSAVYGADTYPMGVLNFNAGSHLFNRVEVRIQAGGDATFFLDNVTVTTLPKLSLWLADTNTAVASWLWPSTGFVLQAKPALGAAGWVGVTNTVEVVNGQNQVTISPLTGNGFFRLFHP